MTAAFIIDIARAFTVAAPLWREVKFFSDEKARLRSYFLPIVNFFFGDGDFTVSDRVKPRRNRASDGGVISRVSYGVITVA